eukprot:2083013-Rhodomonas_salina.1
MALPTVAGANTMYRNHLREVARFFAARHYGAFLVFNLVPARPLPLLSNLPCPLTAPLPLS